MNLLPVCFRGGHLAAEAQRLLWDPEETALRRLSAKTSSVKTRPRSAYLDLGPELQGQAAGVLFVLKMHKEEKETSVGVTKQTHKPAGAGTVLRGVRKGASGRH